jgi:hypothetical protein
LHNDGRKGVIEGLRFLTLMMRWAGKVIFVAVASAAFLAALMVTTGTLDGPRGAQPAGSPALQATRAPAATAPAGTSESVPGETAPFAAPAPWASAMPAPSAEQTSAASRALSAATAPAGTSESAPGETAPFAADAPWAAAQAMSGEAALVLPSASPVPGLQAPPQLPDGLELAPMSAYTADYSIGSKVYPEGGMRMPALIQRDYQTAVATLNGREISVWTSGCGAAVVSMAVKCLTGEEQQTPYTLFRWAVERGLYKGYGLAHDALTAMAALYGVKSRWIEPDEAAILEALGAGHPVIAHMGKGHFTNNGHYIVLRGVAPNGEIYVIDPAVLENSFLTFPLEQIIRESRTDDPFMICAAPGERLPE